MQVGLVEGTPGWGCISADPRENSAPREGNRMLIRSRQGKVADTYWAPTVYVAL